MRRKRSSHGLTVHAVAGTHVVTLGLDLTDEARRGCLGFAIQRHDHTEDERAWMRGMKTFDGTALPPGGSVPSSEHPFQTFQWADYAAKPGYDYSYRVVSLYGAPGAIDPGRSVTVRLTTERQPGDLHSLSFTRGSLASQEYARRFQDRAPSELTGDKQAAAYEWLSRGLLEALVEFVGRADGKRWGLYGAVYEFQWPTALAAIKKAKKSGATVKVVYDGIAAKGGPRKANAAAIKAAGLTKVCTPRTTGKLMHNKFFVLTYDGAPVAVWTGSTNLTENGIFGHSNMAHVVEDPAVAAQFLDYWTELAGSPDKKAENAWLAAHNPSPPDPWQDDVTAVFSPHAGLAPLDWYARIAASAREGLFMTFAFGMHQKFKTVYETDDEVLKFALMDKAGTGSTAEQSRKDINRIRRRGNVVVAIGNRIVTNSYDRWLAERKGIGANVQWVHTKYMLVDPLGPHPVVVTGSANFSDASTNVNNENMLVIRDSKRAADIYLGEFMRLHSHYAFREAVAIAQANGERDFQPSRLAPDDSWQAEYYKPGHQRSLRRRYFART
jgi:hypothetical protein